MSVTSDSDVIVLAIPSPERARVFARRCFRTIEASDRAFSMDETIDALSRNSARGAVFALGHVFDHRAIGRLPESCRILATASVGYDHIDLEAARQRGVAVTNTPDVLTDATADMAMLLLLGAARRIREHMSNMEAGWNVRNGFASSLGRDLSGKTLGIVGMGRIGRALAVRARAFGMRIAYHNRSRLPPSLEGEAKWYPDLNSMLPACDALSLNLPGGQGVVMTPERFSLLPPGAIFVNTARGSLVDEGGLIDALKSGRLFGAGLDVYRSEPDFDRRLLDCGNVVLAPHVGSATEETRAAMAERALENIRSYLATGEAPDRIA